MRRVAVCQMRATANQQQNLATCERLVKAAVAKGAELVCLPECFSLIGESFAHTVSLAQPLTGPLMGSYRELAKANGVWLSLGGFQEACAPTPSQQAAKGEESKGPGAEGKRLFNTHVVVDSNGEMKCVYRKIHLFDVSIEGGPNLVESSFTNAGDKMIVCSSPVGMLGLSTCYDLRFPALYQALRGAGANVLLVPSAFTVPTGQAHWHSLLRARAIETQSYVVAAAQCGQHNAKRASYGHSLVVDPWGRVIADLENAEEAVCVVEVDTGKVEHVRAQMPVASHTRPDVYAQQVERVE